MNISKKYDLLCEYSRKSHSSCTIELFGEIISVKSYSPLDELFFNYSAYLKLRIDSISQDKCTVFLKEIRDSEF